MEGTTGAGRIEARCARHFESAAVGTCERCGNYHCAQCYKELAGRRLCADCLALPGVDYLSATRAKYSGKRDGFIWYLGVLGVLSTSATAVFLFALGKPADGLVSLAMFGVWLSYFLLLPWSRKGVFALVALGAVSAALEVRGMTSQRAAYTLGSRAGSMAVLSLFLVAAYRSTRNKLAFKVDVSDAELSKYYQTFLANPAAARSLAYGMLSLLIPVFVPVAVWFGVRGLRRAESDAWPPAGRRAAAIQGLVFAGLSFVFWVGLTTLLVLRSNH